MSADKFVIVEQMGHRRFGAIISESDYGPSMRRVQILAPMPHDDPYPDGVMGCADISVQSLYAVTECDEATARKANRSNWALRDVVPQLGAQIEAEPVEWEGYDSPDDDNDDSGSSQEEQSEAC